MFIYLLVLVLETTSHFVAQPGLQHGILQSAGFTGMSPHARLLIISFSFFLYMWVCRYVYGYVYICVDTYISMCGCDYPYMHMQGPEDDVVCLPLAFFTLFFEAGISSLNLQLIGGLACLAVS